MRAHRRRKNVTPETVTLPAKAAAPALRAVVFAYHNVGVRCLAVLLAQGIDVALVVTHEDNPGENIWFQSVADLADLHGIPVLKPTDPNVPEVISRICATEPDFVFSFYYRHMLASGILNIPKRGAYNMHGSLLPKYRGRVPVNWAIIKGETETGATLHEMVEKPDAGRIVDQCAVPILPNDTALDVFQKVTTAAEMVLNRALPDLCEGTALMRAQNLAAGSYYGGRKPEDGVINWQQDAQAIHNLIRAVAPPYPGATTHIAGVPVTITRSLVAPERFRHTHTGVVNISSERAIALCGDGRMLRILEITIEGCIYREQELGARLGVGIHPLGP
jgi:methionyl-tRNA formyltransferase